MIRVHIVTDAGLVRLGLETLLKADHEIVIDQTAYDPTALVDPAIVVLLDVAAPNARSLIDVLHKLETMPRVIAINAEKGFESVFDWIEAGCCGHLARDAAGGDYARAVHDAFDGRLALTPEMQLLTMQRIAKVVAGARRGNDRALNKLTERERQVHALVQKGLPDKLIAAQLGIAHATAKIHVHHVLEKTGLHSRHKLRA